MADLKWWETAVIYQIYPRSFQDSNGDGIGDLKGITSRLEYIAGLGVDAIWISPFFKSPQKDFGYDVSDYCDVNPEYGTLADFDQLSNRHPHQQLIDDDYGHHCCCQILRKVLCNVFDHKCEAWQKCKVGLVSVLVEQEVKSIELSNYFNQSIHAVRIGEGSSYSSA